MRFLLGLVAGVVLVAPAFAWASGGVLPGEVTSFLGSVVGGLMGSLATNRRTMRRTADEAASVAVERHAVNCPARTE